MKNNSTKSSSISLIVTTILFILIGGSAIFSFVKISNDQQEIVDGDLENIVLTQEIAKNQQLVVSSERAYLLMKNVTFLKDKKELNAKIESDFKKLKSNLKVDSAKSLVDEIEEARNTYTQLMDHSISETNNGNIENSMELVKDASTYALDFEENISELVKVQKEAINETRDSNDKFINMMTYLLIGLTIIAIIISFVVGRTNNKK